VIGIALCLLGLLINLPFLCIGAVEDKFFFWSAISALFNLICLWVLVELAR